MLPNAISPDRHILRVCDLAQRLDKRQVILWYPSPVLPGPPS
jgi:hypothetical protein